MKQLNGARIRVTFYNAAPAEATQKLPRMYALQTNWREHDTAACTSTCIYACSNAGPSVGLERSTSCLSTQTNTPVRNCSQLLVYTSVMKCKSQTARRAEDVTRRVLMAFSCMSTWQCAVTVQPFPTG